MSFVTINGVSLHYHWRAGHGVPWVLLHEMGGTLNSWDLVLEALPGQAVLRLDLRGFGLSEKPAGPIHLDDHVKDVRGLLDHLGIACARFAGCAVGGGIAIACAAALSTRAQGLLAMAPATGLPRERRAGVLALADMLARDGVRRFLEDDTIPKAWPTPQFDRSGRGFALFLATQLSTAPNSLAETYRMLADMDLTPALSRLTCPARFIAGTHDVARTPQLVQAVSQTVSGATFTQIESGHFMALQTPELVAQLLRD